MAHSTAPRVPCKAPMPEPESPERKRRTEQLPQAASTLLTMILAMEVPTTVSAPVVPFVGLKRAILSHSQQMASLKYVSTTPSQTERFGVVVIGQFVNSIVFANNSLQLVAQWAFLCACNKSKFLALPLVPTKTELHIASPRPVSSIWRRRQCYCFQGGRLVHHGRSDQQLDCQGGSLDGRGWRQSFMLPACHYCGRPWTKSGTCQSLGRQCVHCVRW